MLPLHGRRVNKGWIDVKGSKVCYLLTFFTCILITVLYLSFPQPASQPIPEPTPPLTTVTGIRLEDKKYYKEKEKERIYGGNNAGDSNAVVNEEEYMRTLPNTVCDPYDDLGELHIVVQFPIYRDKGVRESDRGKERRGEYIQAMLGRVLHKGVKEVHVLLEEDGDEKALVTALEAHAKLPLRKIDPCGKLKYHWIGRWMRYSDAMEYANVHLAGKLVVIQNGDISLGRGFEYLSLDHWVDPKHVYVLTRTQHRSGAMSNCKSGIKIGSYDTFVFLSPLPTFLLYQVDFPMNIWGAESRTLWHLKCLNYTISNPCTTLITYHHHQFSGFRPTQSTHDGTEPAVKYDRDGPFSLPRARPADNLRHISYVYPPKSNCFHYPWNKKPPSLPPSKRKNGVI